jgi:hypothetical protein
MFDDGLLQVLELDTETLGFDNELFKFVLEEIGFFGFGGGRALGDHGNGAWANFEQTGVDETGYDFVGGIGVDFEFPAERADGGKFVAGAELARDNGFGGGVDDLLVEREARGEVDVERDHVRVL